ncbi:hypothetical protein ISS07_02850 [Candidatus Woesearchaeota archaeon]|nr:hypothetical protein [Candidatus Woesearchaeota archaeon]
MLERKLYIGTHDRILDAKRRVSVPIDFRKQFGEETNIFYSIQKKKRFEVNYLKILMSSFPNEFSETRKIDIEGRLRLNQNEYDHFDGSANEEISILGRGGNFLILPGQNKDGFLLASYVSQIVDSHLIAKTKGRNSPQEPQNPHYQHSG